MSRSQEIIRLGLIHFLNSIRKNEISTGVPVSQIKRSSEDLVDCYINSLKIWTDPKVP